MRDLYRKVSVAIAKGLRGPVWVRAEISVLRQQNSWCFLTLVEAARDSTESDATLDVVIWRTAWTRIAGQLEERGLALREGMTVSLRGVAGLRPGTGRLQLDCSALDTDALLGELAARRLALRRALAAEGLLDANRRLALGPVPLRIGLVASHHSQGYQDFRNVLLASGYAFVVVEKPVVVQGLGAPAGVAAAIADLGPSGPLSGMPGPSGPLSGMPGPSGPLSGMPGPSGPLSGVPGPSGPLSGVPGPSAAAVDLVVVVRGGGARTDLDAFDSELVARAVAMAAVPVWTGLGHTGDRCLADDVASASFPTPTACAQAIVSRIARFDAAICERARRLPELARRSDRSARDLVDGHRAALARSTAAQLDRHGDATAHRAATLQLSAKRAVSGARLALAASAERLPRLARAGVGERTDQVRQQAAAAGRAAVSDLDRGEDRLRTSARQVATSAQRTLADEQRELAGTQRVLIAFDPTRQLERGWTLTLDEAGTLVRSAADLHPGQRVTSRFIDGERTSIVEAEVSP
ncbi:MAG: exodeoxyribonuclease VII large subunit [Acidimicrobiales bacterium]